MKPQTIPAYDAARNDTDRAICAALRQGLGDGLPGAKARLWHAHPVWFLNDNPIAGYGKLKHCIRLMFWSGQTFNASGLKPTGTFKAAEARFTDPGQIDHAALAAWCAEARVVQWDYKNIVKHKGRLDRL